jgi:transcriptional regulator with XRE-family HTH domain
MGGYMQDEDEGRKILGRMIRSARTENCMTLKDLERKTGIKESTISKVENGVFNTGADTLVRLADGMNMKFELKMK